MPGIEYHLLPVVKRTVGVLAQLCCYTLVASAALSLAELLLLPLHLAVPGILCGMISAALLPLGVALLAVLAAWGHAVLLAGQGMGLTRWLVRLAALLAPLVPVCWVYTMAFNQLLLYRQSELPLILGCILLVAAVLNIPRMAAASVGLQVRVVALPLLLLAAYCTDAPGLLVFCAVFKLLAAWCGAALLRMLASFAPRIISMPEKD